MLHKTHHRVGEVAHILANGEGGVAGKDLFVVNDGVANSISCPSAVRDICERVFGTAHDGDWHIDSFDWNKVGVLLFVSAEPVRVVI